MSAVLDITLPPAPLPLAFSPESSVDMNARRWLWSAVRTENISHYMSGHEWLERQKLLPLNTHESLVPIETPAIVVNDGIDGPTESPYGSQLFTYVEPTPRNLGTLNAKPAIRSGIRKTAAQLAHDIIIGLNSIEERGIGEIVAFRGRFADRPGPAQLSQLYAQILPPEYRVTLKKTLEWLYGPQVLLAIAGVPVLEAALPEFQNLASLGATHLTSSLDAAEGDLANDRLNPRARPLRNAMSGPMSGYMAEMERTPQDLVAVRESVDGQDRIAQSIIQGMREAQSLPSSEMAEMRAILELQGRELAELRAATQPVVQPQEPAGMDTAIEAKGAE